MDENLQCSDAVYTQRKGGMSVCVRDFPLTYPWGSFLNTILCTALLLSKHKSVAGGERTFRTKRAKMHYYSFPPCISTVTLRNAFQDVASEVARHNSCSFSNSLPCLEHAFINYWVLTNKMLSSRKKNNLRAA